MNRNEQRTAETKKNLPEAFLKLYEKKDISQITIREITAALTILRRWIQNGQKESLEELLDFLLQISFQGPLAMLFERFHKTEP